MMNRWPLYYAWLAGFAQASSVKILSDGYLATGLMAILVSVICLTAAELENRKAA